MIWKDLLIFLYCYSDNIGIGLFIGCVGIRPVLNEKSLCPNCSAKCRAEDLLPNVSLRHAVERFLRSQVFADGGEDVHRYAPGKDTFFGCY